MKNDDPVMNRQAAADYIGSTYKTLSTWACTGAVDLKPIKIGRFVRYRKSSLDDWLASGLER